MGNCLSKFQSELASLFNSIPAEFKKTRGELGDRNGDLNDKFISIRAIDWMINNASNIELRRLLEELKQILLERT